MASCLNCNFCNKSSGSLFCIKREMIVSTNEWCKDYTHLFQQTPSEPERKMIHYYRNKDKLNPKAPYCESPLYRPIIDASGEIVYYKR